MARDPDGRVEIFTETANRRGISPVIVEKDFWVCWTLAQVFENPEESPSFLFKGGTSLSKVFNAIQRFSEDIDLSINRHDLGFEDERDPKRATTRNQQKKLLSDRKPSSQYTPPCVRRSFPLWTCPSPALISSRE